MASGPVLEQPLEQVAERALADAPDALGRELHAAFALLDQAGFLELLRELGELFERPRRRRRRAGRAPGRGRPRRAGRGSSRCAACARARRCRRAGRARCPSASSGIGSSPRNAHAAGPSPSAGTRCAGSGRAGRPASADPCRRAARSASSCSCARCSGVIELSSCCICAIERAICSSSSSSVCGLLGEEVAEALHEAFEVGLLAALALLEHVVELGEHVLHARELLGRHLRHALLQLVEHGVEELLLQLLHQLLELLTRGVVHPVVLLQLADPTGEVGRELLELLAPLLRELFEQLLAPLVARLPRVVERGGRCLRAPVRRSRRAARAISS